MKQVFVSEPLSLFQTFPLDEKQAHHIFDVLRTSNKETVRVVSDNQVFLARPENRPFLYIFGKEEVQPPMVDVTLCAALIKNDKFEWMLQKAAELGVSRIVPFSSRNTVVNLDPAREAKRLKRWELILEAACKQSNRSSYVILEPVQTIESLKDFKSELNLVAYEKENLSSHIAVPLMTNPESVTVVIGPEGGFTTDEIDTLVSMGFVPVSLGSTILRAETAACYVLSVIDYQAHAIEAKTEIS